MASQLVTVDVGHVLERAEVEGRIGNEAGQKELQKLAPVQPKESSSAASSNAVVDGISCVQSCQNGDDFMFCG